MPNRVVSTILGLIGGVVGGVVGYFAFFWIARQGFYGLMIPGALIGLGCGLLARHHSLARGVVCGLAAVALGLYTEWKFAPFRADQSFGYLLAHIPELKPITLIMIVVGGLLAFWLGKDASFAGPGAKPAGRAWPRRTIVRTGCGGFLRGDARDRIPTDPVPPDSPADRCDDRPRRKEARMSVTAPDRSHASPMDDPERARQVRQAEELLFSGPSRSGFAKALFRGEFRGDVLFPYPDAPRGRARPGRRGGARRPRVRRRADRRRGDRPRRRHPPRA